VGKRGGGEYNDTASARGSCRRPRRLTYDGRPPPPSRGVRAAVVRFVGDNNIIIAAAARGGR